MIETVLASAAVKFLYEELAKGALKEAGKDAYGIALKKLRGLFTSVFEEEELEKGKTDPAALESLVAKEIENDDYFKNKLEQLVTSLQSMSSGPQDSSVNYSNVGSVNLNVGGSMSGGIMAGGNVNTGVQVTGNNNKTTTGGDRSTNGSFQYDHE
ncbi:MAG: hypothetical protein HC860_14780 [Alkalinema sp. RU_4_3]|nr:hypothetical protein [Alkalinema sp. RU_4_3]